MKGHASFSTLFLTLTSLLFPVYSINLDLTNYTELWGPEDSYFGFSVDFIEQRDKTVSIVVGAPRANTPQPGVTAGGSVFLCPWSSSGETCQSLGFDQRGDENFTFANFVLKAHKSKQWFGSSVRVKDHYILACAPLFHWNVYRDGDEAMNTPVGNCQVLNILSGEVANYAPCRALQVEKDYKYYADRRYCEAGFSSDITKDGRVVLGAPGGFFFQGQIITAPIENIIASKQPFSEVRPLRGEMKSNERYDFYDLYLGYSVATGQLTKDNTTDYVVGVPNDRFTAGSVKILDGSSPSLRITKSLYGTQVASYFGHSVAVTDVNNDGRDDILVGAPLFMEQLSSQHLREVGQVHVYLQRDGSTFDAAPNQKLTGTTAYGRFGMALAPLGDLNQDGFNDVAVGSPSSVGDGRVFIFMGESAGLTLQYAQVLESPFRAPGKLAGFGFTLRGGVDIDDNGYPDLAVGAWGVSKVAVYRAQAVVKAKAQLSIQPDFLNPDVKQCALPQTSTHVSCFTIMMCISVSGYRIPEKIVLDTELQLDTMKQIMARRTLLLQTSQPKEQFQLNVTADTGKTCKTMTAYLLTDFKDKLSPIFISVSYKLSKSQAAVLQDQTTAVAQTRIILDCGEDNICIPDLVLSAVSETKVLLVGDESPALLIVQAENRGEGAYETELQIWPPANTHYQGVLSDREGFTRLVCAQRKDNGTIVVVCDLGNPMKTGQKLKAGLLFSVGSLEEVESHVSFYLQMKSKNSQRPDSDVVHLRINVSAEATLEMRGGSSPPECVLPIAKWEPKLHPKTLDEVGPLVEHVYELRNLGPSTVDVRVEVELPTQHNGSNLLYVFANASEEFLTCETTASDIDKYGLMKQDTMNITRDVHHFNKRDTGHLEQPVYRRRETVHVNCSGGEPCLLFSCVATGLQREGRAVVRLMARLWVQTFLERPYENYVLQSTARYEVVSMHSKVQPAILPSGYAQTETSVVWRLADGEREVPFWWFVVSIITGLILLALLSYIFLKMGFFKRSRPPSSGDEDENQGLSGEDG
ncbi:integrin alpha-IIb [Chanos chanos]|uniref:Integrin alpha-IIb n=1 Tax=Chanos chanos TaxID=29144 RepID=A0A6J2WZS7_CHACN|nr:integrin alpha-IIb-like [Chanos chanos]